MDFDSLKEQLIDRFFELKGKLEESELYIRLRERYDNLAPNQQTLVQIFGVFMALFFVYSLPASYLSSAQEKLAFFEENRELTRELIRAGRLARTLSLPPSSPSFEALTGRVNQTLEDQRVLPEQKTGIYPKESVASTALAPKSIQQTGLKASLKRLNLRQVVMIGESLNSIESSKLINLSLQADSRDPHYFNVDFEVAGFSVAGNESSAPAASPRPFNRRGSRSQ